MVVTLPPPDSPFGDLGEAERELDWQENQKPRRDGLPADLLLLSVCAAGTALLVGLLVWWL